MGTEPETSSFPKLYHLSQMNEIWCVHVWQAVLSADCGCGWEGEGEGVDKRERENIYGI